MKCSMNCRIETSDIFERQLKSLAKRYPSLKADIAQLRSELFENPFMGIDLGKHLRKIRLAITSKGKGKSGGARVITYVITVQEDVTLLTIYDKSDRENISDKELLDLLKACGL